jgi:hypothetical protein
MATKLLICMFMAIGLVTSTLTTVRIREGITYSFDHCRIDCTNNVPCDDLYFERLQDKVRQVLDHLCTLTTVLNEETDYNLTVNGCEGYTSSRSKFHIMQHNFEELYDGTCVC